jgi:hypothetical protein
MAHRVATAAIVIANSMPTALSQKAQAGCMSTLAATRVPWPNTTTSHAAASAWPNGGVRASTGNWGPVSYPDRMNLEFGGEMWFWKGPAPWHFVTVPDEKCGELEATSALVTYGWGMIPVTATIGATQWKTSLFPKDGQYLVPVKAWVRKAEGLELGDVVTVRLAVDV